MLSIAQSAAELSEQRYLDRVDPRLRIIAAVAISVVLVVINRIPTEAVGLALAAAALLFSGWPLVAALRRLVPLNILMLMMVLVLPLTTPGRSLGHLGPLTASAEGMRLAISIALKGNAIVITLIALLGSMDVPTMGHALNHLYVPEKLTHLLLFTVRYLDVLHREYLRLRAAMKTRGFRPHMSWHTYRSIGYLVGMLLVRSFDRSERIVAAMKCRGFQGKFYLLDHFALSRLDIPFGVVSLSAVSLLLLLEWL
jgi:cobalt/nickel transport system permease protein